MQLFHLKEKVKLVKGIKCPYSKAITKLPTARRQDQLSADIVMSKTATQVSSGMKERKKSASTASLSSKSSSSVLLKSMIVLSQNGDKELNILEDLFY